MGLMAGPMDGCLSRLLVNGTARESCPVFSQTTPIYFRIKGETWYRLSELAEID